MNSFELHWLAGLLEGEGSFFPGSPSSPKHPRLSLQMTDEDVMRKAHRLMGIGHLASVNPQQPHHRPSWKLVAKGQPAVHLMLRLRPLMGERRRWQIDRALGVYAPENQLIPGEPEQGWPPLSWYGYP